MVLCKPGDYSPPGLSMENLSITGIILRGSPVHPMKKPSALDNKQAISTQVKHEEEETISSNEIRATKDMEDVNRKEKQTWKNTKELNSKIL